MHFGIGDQISIKKVIKGVSGTRNCVLAFKMAKKGHFWRLYAVPLRVTLIGQFEGKNLLFDPPDGQN